DQFRKPRRHRYFSPTFLSSPTFVSSTRRRILSTRFASQRPVEAHTYTVSDLSLPESPRRHAWVCIFALTCTSVLAVPLAWTKTVKDTTASPSRATLPSRA